MILEFQYYIVQTHGLRKVFISIKGIYFQAEVLGQTITWIVPHRFNQENSSEIDYSLMLTFLEFHEVLMGFVNFKLFNLLGMKYPPIFDPKKDSFSEGILSLTPEHLGLNKKLEPVSKKVLKQTESKLATLDDMLKKLDKEQQREKQQSESNENQLESTKVEEEEDMFDEATKQLKEQQEKFQNLFKGLFFFISREVPRELLEFILRSFGAQVSWEGSETVLEDSKLITHQIVDRGIQPEPKRIERDYIQPQWVFDSVNAKILLPVDIYSPTSKLPPHLSPFVQESQDDENYIPEYQKKINQFINESKNKNSTELNSIVVENNEPEIIEEEQLSEDEEAVYLRELEKEKSIRSGIKGEDKKIENIEQDHVEEQEVEEEVDINQAYFKKYGYKTKGINPKYDNIKKIKSKDLEEHEAKKMAISMLSSKNLRLVEKVERSKRRRQDKIYSLEEKRQKIAKGQLIVKDGVLIKQKKPQ